ncbi:MAG TPA: hypothetical protein VG710_10190 [Opitutus sp.]|nr:hypothetical protein [Opitutus sp.]
MMNELEQRLKNARLAPPSAALERRIEDAFANARRRRRAARQGALWWWTAALATAGGMAALLVVSARRSFPAPVAAVYQIEAEGRLREMLLNPPPPEAGLPSALRVSRTP